MNSSKEIKNNLRPMAKIAMLIFLESVTETAKSILFYVKWLDNRIRSRPLKIGNIVELVFNIGKSTNSILYAQINDFPFWFLYLSITSWVGFVRRKFLK